MTPISGQTVGEGGPRRLETVRSALARTLAAEQLDIARLAFEPDGVLLIEGEAASIPVKKRALRVAAITSGAYGLVDRLHVRPTTTVQDGEIRAHLAQHFALDPRFADVALFEDRDPSPLRENLAAVAGASTAPAGRITIEVRDGIVTLDGAMPSLVRKRLAGVIAWGAPGVRDVINALAVEPPEEDSPLQLEEAVREAFEADPLFDDTQVRVGVFGDSVRLTGLVHSDAARQAAEDDAWRVLGVDEVINEIAVEPGKAGA